MNNILVTGSAGFIGSNLVKRLLNDLKEGTIIGLDNLFQYALSVMKRNQKSKTTSYV